MTLIVIDGEEKGERLRMMLKLLQYVRGPAGYRELSSVSLLFIQLVLTLVLDAAQGIPLCEVH